VLFDGCLVFWRSLPNGNWNLTAFNLTNRTFTDVYTSQDQNWPAASAPACENGGSVIGDTLYTGYSWQNNDPPYFTSTVIYTTDLATFNTLGNINMSLESICQYTGEGARKDTIYFGGYQSMGQGTYSQIDRWHSGTDQFAWNGTVLGSDDVCFLTMFNSTCMIGSDCAPNNIIYTNDGVNFVDEWDNPAYSSQYPFVWAWRDYVAPGTSIMYIAACGSPSEIGSSTAGLHPSSGGMATWTGAGTYTPTSWDPINLYAVSNGLVGGSDNYLNNSTSSWTGHPAIYAYTSTGGFGYQVWENSSDTGAVLSLIYNSSHVWYAIYYDVLNQDVTVIGIDNPSPTTIAVPDDYSTIQSAVNAASPGDTVYVRPGTYRENVQLKETLSLVGEDPQDTIIEGGNVQEVISVLADHVSITGFTISNDQSASKVGSGYPDIALLATSCSISGNVLSGSFAGVELSGSANGNTIIGNEIVNNNWGIYIGAHSPASPSGVVADNNVIRNNITNNDEGIGIGNLAYGNSITRNNVTANGVGILLFESPHDNSVAENTVNKNAVGIDINITDSSAHDNAFYHNNFISNSLQVTSAAQTSVWDNSYPSGGNYWSEYTGTDLLNGPNQNQTGSDGIGDSPYVIDVHNKDNYPLMGPYLTLYSSVAEASISCVSNTTISGIQLSQATMSFNVSGEPGTTGFCALTISHSTILPPYKMEIDGSPISCATTYEDTTESVIYFTYQHSAHEVTIIGAFINVKSLKTVVCQGYSLNVAVTAADLGDSYETFNVTVYANTTIVASQDITLSSEGTANVTFTCDTTGLPLGRYTISAYAWPFQGETNTTNNNNFTGGFVYVSMVGDLTGPTPFVPDGKVDGRDMIAVAKCFGSRLGDPSYNPNCDLFNCGEIDGRDITIVAKHFGEHTTKP